MTEVVRLEDISKFYHTKSGETQALKDINFTVAENEFVSIIGPSGCGKSTILSIIAGLEKPSGGTVYINGEATENKIHAHIGYMLQQDHLFPWLTVKQNALLGLDIRHEKTKEKEAYVEALLRQYELESFSDALPSQLSGGMRQRAAIIRTLAVNPTVLLLDEPFSALDYQTRLQVGDDIGQIIRKEGNSAILVTHDLSEAISLADRVIVLSGRPATIQQTIPLIFDLDRDTPLARRNAPEFKTYFNLIWEELNANV